MLQIPLSVRTGMPGLSLDNLWNHDHHMLRISGWKPKWNGSFPVRMSCSTTAFLTNEKMEELFLNAYFRGEKYKKMYCKFLILPSSIDRHDNQVGRWLTNFRATWDPKFDSYAVVGSMKQPRQVRFSHLCGFSIVWSLHVKSNLNG